MRFASLCAPLVFCLSAASLQAESLYRMEPDEIQLEAGDPGCKFGVIKASGVAQEGWRWVIVAPGQDPNHYGKLENPSSDTVVFRLNPDVTAATFQVLAFHPTYRDLYVSATVSVVPKWPLPDPASDPEYLGASPPSCGSEACLESRLEMGRAYILPAPAADSETRRHAVSRTEMEVAPPSSP